MEGAFEVRTVLIVDASSVHAARASNALAPHGFECLHSTSCDGGFESARRHGPDLILVDVFAPEMDGFALTRKLSCASETAGIPILMTGYPPFGTQRLKALGCGAREFLPKPADAHELVDAVLILTAPPLPAASVAY